MACMNETEILLTTGCFLVTLLSLKAERTMSESNPSTRLESILKPDSTLGTRYTEV